MSRSDAWALVLAFVALGVAVFVLAFGDRRLAAVIAVLTLILAGIVRLEAGG